MEEDILERARQKMILDHLVIQKMNASGQLYLDNKGRQGNKGGKMFKEDDLKAILRFGAEDLFKDKESGEESERKLENMDIDEILARAEKVSDGFTNSFKVFLEDKEKLGDFLSLCAWVLLFIRQLKKQQFRNVLKEER